MATTKSSILNRLNSPGVGRLFGSLLVLLMLTAAGYGGYTLFNQRFGSAAFSHSEHTYPLYDLSHDGIHFYTAFVCERDYVINKEGYELYRIAGYVYRTNTLPKVCSGKIDDNIFK